MTIPVAPEFRFWVKVLPVDSGCWEWQGNRNQTGYGLFTVGGRRSGMVAHRFSYDRFVASIPDGLKVLHRCDNRRCVNPAHLFLGTQLDNMRDASQKGRIVSPNTWKTHCPQGHEYTEANTHFGAGRQCRVCGRIRAAAKYRANPERGARMRRESRQRSGL